jgi:putative oxidoreductase
MRCSAARARDTLIEATGLSPFASSALAVVFLWAGTSKLRDRNRFRSALAARRWASRWLSGNVVATLSWLVPATEMLCGLLIVIPPLRFIGAVLSSGLVVAFTVLLVADLLSGEDVGCGCFGGGLEERVSWMSVARNFLLLALAGITLRSPVASSGDLWPPLLSGIGVAFMVILAEEAHMVFSRYSRGLHPISRLRSRREARCA